MFVYIAIGLYLIYGLYMVISIIRMDLFIVKLNELEKEVGKEIGTAELFLFSFILLLVVIFWPIVIFVGKQK